MRKNRLNHLTRLTKMTRWLLLGAAVLTLVALADCGDVPLTAPSGAELSITANPTTIPAVNGVSTITVQGFKSADDGGGTLSDGTQIFFTTNVGIIENRVEMHAGTAIGFLRSDGRAGSATVEARSGAGITATLANPVLIGNAGGVNILVTANPATVSAPDFTSEILATVFDNDNNMLRDVPVVFSTSAGALASQGSILRTNRQGQAFDRLTLENEASATVTVTSGSVSGSTTVSRGTVNNPIVSSVFPSSGAPGDTLNVTITGLNFQPGATVSFGQGISINSITFIDGTQLVVNITIDAGARVEATGRTVTVTNPDGSSGRLPDAFRVQIPGVSSPTITDVFPPSTAVRNPTTETLTITGTNFLPGAVVGFTPAGDIGVVSITVDSDTQITVVIRVETFAAGGPPIGGATQYDVTVRNTDGGEFTKFNAFTVN